MAALVGGAVLSVKARPVRRMRACILSSAFRRSTTLRRVALPSLRMRHAGHRVLARVKSRLQAPAVTLVPPQRGIMCVSVLADLLLDAL
jgi:hypothetical protein